jgi:hypothetical protein
VILAHDLADPGRGRRARPAELNRVVLEFLAKLDRSV